MLRSTCKRLSALDIHLTGSVWTRTTLRNRQGQEVNFHTVPLTHIATKSFYDLVLEYCKDARATSPAAVAIVEGVQESEARRENEEREHRLIHSSPALSSSVEAKAIEGTLFATDVIKEICGEYKIDFEKLQQHNQTVASPEEIVRLQDDYLKPLLAVYLGDTLVSGDAVIPATELAQLPAVSFSAQREAACWEVISKHFGQGSRDIILLWGHYHTPRILSIVEKNLEVVSRTNVRQIGYGIPRCLL